MNYYIGTITKIIDPDLYKIEVDIPGKNYGLQAFPKRGELDEPRVGDSVILLELDPIYHSYYLYEKLKENNFIGVRSRGKLVKITSEEILIGIYKNEDWFDTNDGNNNTPEPTSWIKIDSTGNINITSEGSNEIYITGNSNIKVDGNTKLECPNITIDGGGSGSLTVNGMSSTNGSGPFCGIPVCPFSGAPHIGNTVSGT